MTIPKRRTFCILLFLLWVIIASWWMVYHTGYQIQVAVQECATKSTKLNADGLVNSTVVQNTLLEVEYKEKLQYYQSMLNTGKVSLKEEKCILIMLTYKRIQTLPRVLKHYCRVSILSEIVLIWNDVGEAIPTNITFLSSVCNIQLTIIKSTQNRLTNRFIPRPELGSDCICIIDDDRIVANHDMEFGFEVWQSFRQRVVGFEERGYLANGTGYVYTSYNRMKGAIHSQRKRSSKNSVIEIRNGTRILRIGNKTYILGKAVKKPTPIVSNSTDYPGSANGYSIMLTSVCFVHRIYLEMFFDPLFVPSTVLDEIDRRKNCEDIMLSILVTKFLHDISWPQCGVLAVKAAFGITNLDQEANKLGGREGLSSRKNHYDERSKCLNIFAEMYGYLPLLNSTVVLAKF